MNKIEEALNISEEILSDLELNRISLEQIWLKCLRLARLLWDTESIKWFALEINGYDYSNKIEGIDTNEYYGIAIKHWRSTTYENPVTKTQEQRFWSSSIPELEALVKGNNIALNNIQTPNSYTPAVSSWQTEWYYSNTPLKTEFVQEKYQDVLNKTTERQNVVIGTIKNQQSTLGKIKAHIYQYVLEKNYELKYWNTVYSIFEDTRIFVIEEIWRISQDWSSIMSSIYDNLNSENSVDWSNAVFNCRRILQLIADIKNPFNPDRKEKVIGKKTINLWADSYINRIIDYIETKSNSWRFNDLVWSHLGLIGDRLDSIYESANKWAHTTINTKSEVERYVIYTFMLLNDILSLK